MAAENEGSQKLLRVVAFIRAYCSAGRDYFFASLRKIYLDQISHPHDNQLQSYEEINIESIRYRYRTAAHNQSIKPP